jgi:PD-(D/E)XK endonuclease
VFGSWIGRLTTAQEIDAIAAYCHQLKKCYLLPISLVGQRREVSLRLSRARNNQRKGLNSAFDYELGAIAQLGERVTGSHEVAGSSPASSTTHAAHNGRLFS